MEKSSDSDMLSRDSSSIANDEVVHTNETNGTNPTDEYKHTAKRPKIVENEKRPMHDDYVHLIEVCKSVDRTEDMKKIGAKLEKYYYKAHPDYVNSKSFHRLVQSVISEIQAEPKLVYMKIKNLLEELKTRQPTEGVNMATAEDPEQSEADKKKTIRIQRLSEALCSLQRRIKKCEEAEVDWDDENNSKYLMTERFKQRACDIYNKLCDLTGESRSAERIVKKPIKFIGTSYPEFNRKLEKFINETKAFPDMFDVLRIMDHCSKHYNYRLNVSERKIVGMLTFLIRNQRNHFNQPFNHKYESFWIKMFHSDFHSSRCLPSSGNVVAKASQGWFVRNGAIFLRQSEWSGWWGSAAEVEIGRESTTLQQTDERSDWKVSVSLRKKPPIFKQLQF